MHSRKITLGLAVLGIGTALATGAFAQNSPTGRGVNDGGVAYGPQNNHTQNSGQQTGSISNSEAQRPGPSLYNFGGQGQPPDTSGNHSPAGRSVNDGGMGYTPQNQSQR